MRIDTKKIPGLRDLTLDTPDSISFSSSLPSEDLLSLAWGNPNFAGVIEQQDIGRSLVANTAQANRWAQGISGINLGVPSAVLPDFKNAVWKWGPSRWTEYGAGVATSAMDLALDNMGAIPVIGWAAQVALSVVKILVNLSNRNSSPPPNLRYDKEADELAANKALRMLYGRDLRQVFMPPAREVNAWEVHEADPGFVVNYFGRSSGAISETDGLGVLPGSSVVAGELFSHKRWNEDEYLSCNASGRVCQGYNRNRITKSVRASIRRDWRNVFEGTIMPEGDTLPSLRRVGATIWSMLSSTKSANAFELDTTGLADHWSDWSDAADSLAREAMNGGIKKMGIDQYVGFQALQKSARLPFYGIDSDRTLGAEAGKRVAELRTLQEQLLDTLVVAYCAEDQKAFRGYALRGKLQERRAQLLTHPARWRVDTRDIIDLEYRAAMESAKAGDRPLVAVTTSGEFDRKPRRVSPLAGVGESSSSGGLLLLVFGGLLAASL